MLVANYAIPKLFSATSEVQNLNASRLKRFKASTKTRPKKFTSRAPAKAVALKHIRTQIKAYKIVIYPQTYWKF